MTSRRHIRTIIQGTEQEIEDPSMDRPCDLCDDQPATREGLEFRATYYDPEEWLGTCDECGDRR